MPYIKKEDRRRIAENQEKGMHAFPRTAGELNYLITSAVVDYIAINGLNYQTLNEAIGVLECAKLELYRRVAAKYEDKKIAENGDVYPVQLGGYNE